MRGSANGVCWPMQLECRKDQTGEEGMWIYVAFHGPLCCGQELTNRLSMLWRTM